MLDRGLATVGLALDLVGSPNWLKLLVSNSCHAKVLNHLSIADLIARIGYVVTSEDLHEVIDHAYGRTLPSSRAKAVCD